MINILFSEAGQIFWEDDNSLVIVMFKFCLVFSFSMFLNFKVVVQILQVSLINSSPELEESHQLFF